MAYFTMITEPRDLTQPELDELEVYLTAQVNAGTTNNRVYVWETVVVSYPNQNVRIWSTSESANGYKAILAGFSPPVPVSVY